MKFITEYDLRAKFNAQSFTKFVLEQDCRLTPGAMSFLSDRKVEIVEHTSCCSKPDPELFLEEAELLTGFMEKPENIRLEILEACFLKTAGALLDSDFGLSKELLRLRGEIRKLRVGSPQRQNDGDDEDKPPVQVLTAELEIDDLCLRSPDAEKIITLNLLFVKTKWTIFKILKENPDWPKEGVGRGLLSVAECLFQIIKGLSGVGVWENK